MKSYFPYRNIDKAKKKNKLDSSLPTVSIHSQIILAASNIKTVISPYILF